MDVPEENNKKSALPPEESTTKKKEKSFWHIDKEMFRFKLHYFLIEGALGISVPFLTLFAKNRIGISATALAAILTTQQFLFIFTKPIIGYLADYFNKLKSVICIVTVLSTVSLFLLLAIPKINNYRTEENHIQTSFVPKFNTYQNESCKPIADTTARLRTDTKSSLFCSVGSVVQLEFLHECSNASTNQSNRAISNTYMSSTTNGTREISVPDGSKHINTSHSVLNILCALCCNNTEDCYIVSCPNQSEPDEMEVSQFRTYPFWEFAFTLTIAQVSINALFTLSDTACCETVVKTGADMGRQRLYGAISWGIMSAMGGLLTDYTGDYLPAWIITGILFILSLWNLWKLDLVQPQFSQNVLKDVGTVMSSKEFLTFQIGVFMNGVGIGIVWYYQIWFLSTIGASRFLCGLVQTVQCVAGEIPCMFYSGWFIQKMGHFNVQSLALLAYCARFLWYSYLENPWLVLPIEWVHGITYGIFYPCVASYAKLSSKPGTEATTQSILFSTHEGLGAGIGCVIAGIGFDNIGGHQTFFYASIFSGCGILINLMFTFWNRKQKNSVPVTTPVTE